MTPVSAPASPTSYGQFYYQHCCGIPYARTEPWLQFFGGIAERVVRDIAPASVLDAGCAFGFLVESLRDRGVDAYGLDVSEYAIQQVREDVKQYCRVGSVLEPLPRPYDLIICIEVLEHLSPQECERAVENFCQASDDILFSSTPDDYREASHVNVRPPEYWAGLFARHGFYRDVEFDASFITAWAMRFRRATEPGLQPAYRLVETYERRLWQLNRECAGAHHFAVEMRDQLASAQARLAMVQAVPEGTQTENQRLSRQLHDVQASPGWRFVVWVGKVRARVFPPGTLRERWWFRAVNRIASWLK